MRTASSMKALVASAAPQQPILADAPCVAVSDTGFLLEGNPFHPSGTNWCAARALLPRGFLHVDNAPALPVRDGRWPVLRFSIEVLRHLTCRGDLEACRVLQV